MRNLISLQYIHPPALPENIISREKLNSLLLINSGVPLILVNAAAGYGKTVLLTAYHQENSQSFVWLTVPANISSPSHFIEYIVKAIQLNHASFGVDILSYIENFTGKWNKNNIIELSTIFLNEAVNSLCIPITLIIDDFQNLETEQNSEWINILFTELFTALPNSLKFIISTRQTLPFKTSRLEAKRQIYVLATEDFRFGYEDTLRLAKESYNITDSKACEKLLKHTDGWITAMHMLLSGEYLKNPDTGFTENLYSYIAEDIFSNIEDSLKSFLIKTAYLDTFNESFVDKLLNINNSKDIISKLISRNIFLEKASSGNNDYYFYQKLFSDFLRKHVAENISKDELKNNYLCIADTYINESKPEEALYFLIEAGNIERFKEIVMKNIESKFEHFDFFTIGKWLSLSGNLPNYDIHFKYYRLKYLIKINKFEDINIDYFDEITLENDEFQCRVTILKAEYLLLTGKLYETLKLLNCIETQIESAEIKVMHMLLLCKAYYRFGFEYQETLINLAEEAIEFFDKNNNINEKLELIGYLANVHSNKWENLAAIRYHEMALHLERDTQKVFIHFSNLIDLYSEAGQYEKAYNFIKLSEDIYYRYPTPYFQRLFIRSKTKFYNNLGDYILSLKFWSELQNNMSIAGNDRLSLNYYQHYCEIYYFLGDVKSAVEYYRLSEKYRTDDKYVLIMNNFVKHYYCNRNILSIETEESILKVLEYHEANNLQMIIPQMEYYLAKINIEKYFYEFAEKYINSVMLVYKEKQQTTFLETELFLSRKLFDFAISQNVEKKFIGTVFDAIKNKLSLDFISEEYREELKRRIFRLTDIYFSSFGNTEFYQRGEVVADDKWIRKKSKILLAYLMCDPEKIHTKDKIMDIFFDDMPADKADVVYHSAIYNIRTALKIYDIKTDKPKRSKDKTYDYNPQYILYEDKTLRLNPDFYYISESVEFEKHYNKTRLPALSNEEKITHSVKAIEMYKGDFLPGYYDSWCEELRVKYKNMYITLCEELIKILETEARYDEVIKYSELLLKEDKLNDQVHISIINAYSKSGNINMAKSRYEIMMKIYDEELGEKPQSKTLSMINSILAEK